MAYYDLNSLQSEVHVSPNLQDNPYWLLLLVPALGFVAWLYRRFVSGFAPKQRRLLTQVILVWLTIQVLLTLAFNLRHFDVDDLVRLAVYPASMAANIAIFVAAFIFIRYWRPTLLLPDDAQDTDAGEEFVRQRLRRVLSSNDFLTALNEALPKGADDREHGLDYVPYLLQSVRLRRERFDISSRRFLRLTLALGIVSAAIIGTFGWVLLDEAAVGAPRALRDVRDSLDDLAASASNVSADYQDSVEYRQLRQALSLDPGARLAPVREQMLMLLERSGSTPADLDALLRTVSSNIGSVRAVDDREGVFARNVRASVAALDAWRKRQQELSRAMAASNARLTRLLPQLEAAVGKDEARLTELIRRLAIGVIVATFFLALVRFVGSLYRSDYREVLRADLDDMFVRSFYISFKAAGANPEQRTAVLSTLVSTMAAARDATSEKPASTQRPKEELEIIKELVSAAAKKL